LTVQEDKAAQATGSVMDLLTLQYPGRQHHTHTESKNKKK
jgi:hypothetical protein